MFRFFGRPGPLLAPFWLDFGSQLGAMLATFQSKWGDPVACSPLFGWVYVIFRFGGPPGPLLAPFGLDFGGFGAPFWRFLGSILEVLGLPFGRFWLGMGWWGYAKRKEF